MGFDDMFRLPDDVLAQFKRVADKGLRVWDETSGKMTVALNAKLASIRARTRRLYAVSQADFEEVIAANEQIGRAVVGASDEALQGARLWQAMNENLVRAFGEMQGITDELTQAGARLNQIYVDNEAAILAGTYRMDDDVRDLIVRIHDRAARAFEIQNDLIVMGARQGNAVEAVRLGNTGGVDLNVLDDAFRDMLRATEISIAYVKGDGGYIGQFPLAVQQAKLLAAGDESVTQLIRLAETLDPARAVQLVDDAVAAGTPAAAARMPGKWAKIRTGAFGTDEAGTPMYRTYRVSDDNINITVGFPEPGPTYPHARTANITWRETEGAYDTGGWWWKAMAAEGEMGVARRVLPGLKRLDEIVQELSDEGFTITAQATGNLL